VAYLRSGQDPEGGFRRLCIEGVPLAVYSANVLNGLKAAGLPASDPMVERALSWLLSCQNPDGGFGMAKGTDSVALSTAWTIKALRDFGMEPADGPVRKAVDWLLDRQHEPGGFSNTPAAQEDPEITSLAMLALRTLPKKERPVERAVSYLARVQNDDGSFTGNTPMQFKGESKKNTQTTVFVVWALSELL
jgi:prenyltransferase beta subunit